MIWDIIEAKLTAAGLASEGVNLFRQAMPSAISKGIMLRAPLEGIAINPHIPGFYKPALQIIVRHSDPVEGQRLANEIQKVLTVEAPEDHPETSERGRVRLSIFYPKSLPIQYPRLDGNTIEWSLNFTTAFSIQNQ